MPDETRKKFYMQTQKFRRKFLKLWCNAINIVAGNCSVTSNAKMKTIDHMIKWMCPRARPKCTTRNIDSDILS